MQRVNLRQGACGGKRHAAPRACIKAFKLQELVQLEVRRRAGCRVARPELQGPHVIAQQRALRFRQIALPTRHTSTAVIECPTEAYHTLAPERLNRILQTFFHRVAGHQADIETRQRYSALDTIDHQLTITALLLHCTRGRVALLVAVIQARPFDSHALLRHGHFAIVDLLQLAHIVGSAVAIGDHWQENIIYRDSAAKLLLHSGQKGMWCGTPAVRRQLVHSLRVLLVLCGRVLDAVDDAVQVLVVAFCARQFQCILLAKVILNSFSQSFVAFILQRNRPRFCPDGSTYGAALVNVRRRWCKHVGNAQLGVSESVSKRKLKHASSCTRTPPRPRYPSRRVGSAQAGRCHWQTSRRATERLQA